MGGNTVPEELRARIKEMYLSGDNTRTIAAAVGLHRTSINRILGKQGIRVPRRESMLIFAYKDELVRLHKKGLSVYLVAEHLGIAKSTALDWLRKLGLVKKAEERTDGLDMTDEESRLVDLTAEVYRLSNHVSDAGEIAKCVGEDIQTVQKIIEGKPDWWNSDDHDERTAEYWNPKLRTKMVS